ncbi:MAG: copper oxidase [Halobacteriovorax sp.]|nr:copper oxidase [Halobacteriovorax sp.]
MNNLFLILCIFTGQVFAATIEYDLKIEEQDSAMTINSNIPGPVLTFTEGDIARIHVTNRMNVETSIHWHGLILPNFQDGVPYLTTPPILPGKTFTYEFPLIHSGTYWYHSHTGLQEQLGVYGSIVIKPKTPSLSYDRDVVLVLSDWTNENPNEVLRTLKRGSEWYGIKKKSAVSLYEAARDNALKGFFNMKSMLMPGVDISDIAYDAFWVNGKETYTLSDVRPGEKVRLRVVNAGASTYFWTTFGVDSVQLVSTDGVDVVPIKVEKVLHAIAETYDYLFTMPPSGAVEIKVWAQDGSGSANAILGKGKLHKATKVPTINYTQELKKSENMDMSILMTDHSMEHSNMEGMGNMEGMSHMEHSKPNVKTLSYEQLKSKTNTKLKNHKNLKEMTFDLNGNMWRYIWSINGKTLSEVDKIKIEKGQAVRITLNNYTMMHHPMHLHGHFFRVVNSNGDYSPLKHTVDVAPMSSVTIEFDANESGDWFFHCHVLYHMKGGMARVFSYGTPRDQRLQPFKLSNILEMDNHWFTWGSVQASSHMSSLEFTSSNTRNQFNLGGEYGYNKNLEADISYERYVSDYFRLFIGANSENEKEDSTEEVETLGTIGARWLLPYFIDSELRVDSDLNVIFSLGTEYLIFPRTMMFARWEIGNNWGWKKKLEADRSWDREYTWSAGLDYVLSKQFILTSSYDNRFGAGAGLIYLW